MPESSYTGKIYRLRAGSPMPVNGAGRFVMHTFMAEVNDIDMISCTSSLPSSTDFRGQGGEYFNATFSRLNVKGGEVFSGKIVHSPTYVDEDDI